MVYIFVINLDNDTKRFEKFKNKDIIRWKATHYSELSIDDPIIEKMISYWNIRHTNQHLAVFYHILDYGNILLIIN